MTTEAHGSTLQPEPAGDVRTALQHAARLLQRDPVLAAQQAEEILAVYPDLVPALLVLGASCRLRGDPQRGVDVLQPLAAADPGAMDVNFELGLCLGASGRGDEACTALRAVLQKNPQHAGAWGALADQLALAGDEAASRDAQDRHLAASAHDPQLIEAAQHLSRGDVRKAEPLARALLKKQPTNVTALRLLADIGVRVGQFRDAAHMLEHCLQLAPEFHAARHSYAVVLLRLQAFEAALREVDLLLKAEPANPNYQVLKGTTLVRTGDHVEALRLYEQVLLNYPNQARAQMNYGHTLKTVGRVDDAVRAYRTCIALSPAVGEAYWSLANLKTYHFGYDDIAAMREQLQNDGGDPDDRSHIAFALGKAMEDRGQVDESFAYYKLGNDVRHRQHPYSAKINVFNTARQIKLYTADFFQARAGQGCQAPDPIFIVGLPRAGSTLLEQILASHSQVEGTAELTDIIALSRRLGRRTRDNPASQYPEIVAEQPPDQLRAFGEEYIAATRIQRSGLPYFIDKMPNNFQHIGLIHLILPNAKIIDARRHPMAGCFSCYKQLFARGQTFTYDLDDLGRYYRDYVLLMAHWNTVLPGRVLCVHYEDVVADTEQQVRRLLDHCGLPFEDQCLRFYETERAIRTPSSEQVRQPVYREGLEQWRKFDHHLSALRESLGPALDAYRKA